MRTSLDILAHSYGTSVLSQPQAAECSLNSLGWHWPRGTPVVVNFSRSSAIAIYTGHKTALFVLLLVL